MAFLGAKSNQTSAVTAGFAIAANDVASGLLDWKMWGRMGWAEVRRRYRRTVIGPFWTSLSLGIFVLTMGTLFATLWNQSAASYLPFLCSGMIAWVLVSTILSEGCQIFIAASGILLQMPFNFTILVCAMIWRNLIVFLHNMLIFALLAVFLGVALNAEMLLIIPGIFLTALNGLWMATLLGMICTRYRDVQQVVSSLIQIAMFVTPVFWQADQLGSRGAVFTAINPLYHMVDIIRAPLLGKAPAPLSYILVSLMVLIGWPMTLWLLDKYRSRIVFWL